MQVRKQQLEPDMEQFGKGARQGCILSPCLFDLYAECIMQNAKLDEAQAGIKIARRNINNLRYAKVPSDTQRFPYGRKQGGIQEPLDKSERRKGRSWLKAQHLKN